MAAPIFWIRFCSKKFFTALLRWHGAQSCMKISQLWTLVWRSSLLFNKLTYVSPFMVVPGGKNRVQLSPWRTSLPIGGCFTGGVVHVSSKRVPAAIQTGYLWTINCCTVDSSETRTFFHISMSLLACLLAKSRRFFVHHLSQSWFSGWLARFETKIQRQPALNRFGSD